MKWNDLTMKERSDLMSLFLKHGIGSLSDMRRIYDGEGDIEPAVVTAEYPRNKEVLDIVNSSDANWVRRLKDPNRQHIQDWKDHNSIATHKLSWAEDNGKFYIYPEVQEINGRLYDFTDPKRYNGEYRPDRAWTTAFDSALYSGDVVEVPSAADARWFTGSYKNFYPTFNKFDTGGPIKWIRGFLKGLVGSRDADDSTTNKKNNTERQKRLIRVLENDSPTKLESEAIEDDIADRHKSMIKYERSKGYPSSEEYYIPYIYDKEIILPGVGRTSENMLDSLYVNAQKAGISFQDALGLTSIETKMGAIPNISTEAWIDAFKTSHKRAPTSEEIKQRERAQLNSSYARNFGGIYPQFLINDHEWWNRGWEESPKYKTLLRDIDSPLQHGFTMYKLGIYNSGEKTHSSKVRREGNRLMNTTVIQDYLAKKKK